MKNITCVLVSFAMLSACATNKDAMFTKESLNNPSFSKDIRECTGLAEKSQNDSKQSAIGGAAVGAGMGLLVGALLGTNLGNTAGMGAMMGGANAYAGTASRNRHEFRRIQMMCMRDRGYHAY